MRSGETSIRLRNFMGWLSIVLSILETPQSRHLIFLRSLKITAHPLVLRWISGTMVKTPTRTGIRIDRHVVDEFALLPSRAVGEKTVSWHTQLRNLRTEHLEIPLSHIPKVALRDFTAVPDPGFLST